MTVHFDNNLELLRDAVNFYYVESDGITNYQREYLLELINQIEEPY